MAATTDEQTGDGNYDRNLGVIEAIMIVTRSCPNGRVVSVAEQALEAIKTGGADVIKNQAYFVLTAMQGWRGERASQVHRSLKLYLDEKTEPSSCSSPPACNPPRRSAETAPRAHLSARAPAPRIHGEAT